ncbi:hypothetical protein NFI96_001861 [Prochilodus magdalenae]|nr:hypothetical protein NFI96_001861 [Prochilodus magdalenae]
MPPLHRRHCSAEIDQPPLCPVRVLAIAGRGERGLTKVCGQSSACTGFHSPYTCGCGQPGHAHATLVESREEREARGLPVGRPVPYAAMGGLTGFSSLIEGYLRLDPSGSAKATLIHQMSVAIHWLLLIAHDVPK